MSGTVCRGAGTKGKGGALPPLCFFDELRASSGLDAAIHIRSRCGDQNVFSHQYIGQETATSIASIARLALSSSAPVRPPIWQCNTSRCKSLYSSLRPKCPAWIKRYQNRENARPKNAISSLREREEMCLYGCDVLP